MTEKTISENTDLSLVNMQNAVSDIMLHLNEKETEVLTKRFSLNDKPKQTLEKIGRKFSITRERVRQIEENALNKLRRVVQGSKLKTINSAAEDILMENGGIISEEKLMSEILNKIGKEDSSIEGSIIKLSLKIDTEIQKFEKNSNLSVFWRFMEVKIDNVNKITNAVYKILSKKGELCDEDWILSSVNIMNLFDGKKPTSNFIFSAMDIDKRIKNTAKGWGLSEWRFVNPKSIKDKASLILSENKKPMHFLEISNLISSVGIHKKNSTTQAVHNELIKYEDFVLVGRGTYGLKSWGLVSGSVSDVIVNILMKKGTEMKKQDIITEVQKLRDVKVGTISLNLQKSSKFERVGRAVYTISSK